jgi:hypothetical protein
MVKKFAIVISLVLVVLAGFAYYRYTLGVIGPHEIYPEALGQTRKSVENRLGRPLSFDEIGNGLALAHWQGYEPYSWIFSIWYLNDVAVHISMPNDLVVLDIQDVKDRVGQTIDWEMGSVLWQDRSYPALTNDDLSIVIYETAFDYQVANSSSIFWELDTN